MKSTLLSLAIIFTLSVNLSGQCQISNGSFENWGEFPVEGDGITTTNVFLPEDAFPTIRFLFWFFEGPAAMEEALQADPIAFIGIEQSTDASDGEFAVKLQDAHPDVIGIADVYNFQACNFLPDSITLDVKHVGESDTDILQVYAIFDTRIVAITADPNDSPYIINGEIAGNSAETYGTYSFPVVENFPSEIDSFVYGIAATTTAASYFLVDNVRLVYDNPISTQDEIAIKTVQIIQNPVSDILRLSVNEATNEAVEISIIDPNGRILLIQSYESIDNHLEFNIQNYRSGTYFIQLKSKEGIVTHKFVKI